MGFGVWSHHMFTSGMGPLAESGFAISTMLIAVPTGIKIFNWIGTTWQGQIRLTTPMLFSLGFIAMFIIGGLSGVTHAISPADTQQHDTYYVVAHFHYVLFGGAILGFMAGAYYWIPKFMGRMLSEFWGKVNFWLMLIGFNLTFGPMHILGLNGMPRRTYRYGEDLGWDFWNLMATIGAFLIALSVLVFIANLAWARKRGPIAGDDPWDARTLEWATTSPPPEHNFDEIPVVHARDELWYRKYEVDEDHYLVPRAEPLPETSLGPEESIHMPSPSFYPALSAVGIGVVMYGIVYQPWGFIASGIGAVIALWGLLGWSLEPVTRGGEHAAEGHA